MRKIGFLLGMSLAFGAFASDSESLIDAVADDDIEQVQSLLAAGADVNAKHDGVVAIHAAGSVAMAKLLIEAGADVNVKEDKEGMTALHIAARRGGGSPARHYRGDSAVAQVLIEAGADINAAAKDQVTPLHAAAIACNVAPAKALLLAGAEVNAKAWFMGNREQLVTPLDIAALSMCGIGGEEQTEIYHVLVANGGEGEFYQELLEQEMRDE